MFALLRNFSSVQARRILLKEIKLFPSRPPIRRAAASAATKTAAAAAAQGSHAQFSLMGTLERGASSKFAVRGEEFVVDNNTWIFGQLNVGAEVMVQGVFRKGDERYAKKIIVKQ
jgi:hypothetical protein